MGGRPAGCYDRRVIHGKNVTVVLPAHNAERTPRRTIEEIPEGLAAAGVKPPAVLHRSC